MYRQKITAAFVAGIAAASLALAAAPAGAQTDPAKPPVTAKKKPPTQVAMTTRRPPTRVTVPRRSFLDPGTETKARAEHYQDYAFPPGGGGGYSFSNDYNITFGRSPLPTCFDLPGFCR